MKEMDLDGVAGSRSSGLMRRLRRAMVLVALPCTLASLPVAMGAPELRVAVVGPETGPYAAYWMPIREGAHAAAQAGSVLGQSIRVEFADDQGGPEGATKVAERLARTKVVGVIGHLLSSTTRVALPVYAKSDIPVLPPVAHIPDGPSFPNLVQLGAAPGRQGGIGALFLSRRAPKTRLAVLFVEDGEFGARVLDTFTKAGAQEGLKIRYVDRFSPRQVSFFDRLRSVSPQRDEGVFFWGAPFAAVEFVKAWRELRHESALVVAPYWGLLVGPREVEKVAQDLFFVGLDYAARAEPTIAALKAYEAKPPTKDGIVAGSFLQGYAAMQVLLHGLQKAGTTDGRKVIEAIVKDRIPTVAGPFRFTDKRESTRATYAIYQLRGGGYVLAQSTDGGDCCPNYKFCCP